ncbi:MAG: hypothetical protein K0R05_4346 [Anaerocolumna sp.]|jgi:hypothetical protein|nr:hypothetical protein [Anaerocolumna sp.]
MNSNLTVYTNTHNTYARNTYAYNTYKNALLLEQKNYIHLIDLSDMNNFDIPYSRKQDSHMALNKLK